MDPEVRARLRGLSPGSREYQAAIDAYNREKAAQREREMGLRQQEEEQRAAREERRVTAGRGRAGGATRERAGTARGINPASPGARAAYGDVVSAAERGNLLRRPIPWGTGLMAGGLAGMGAYSTFGRAPEARSDIERALWTGTGDGEGGAGTEAP